MTDNIILPKNLEEVADNPWGGDSLIVIAIALDSYQGNSKDKVDETRLCLDGMEDAEAVCIPYEHLIGIKCNEPAQAEMDDGLIKTWVIYYNAGGEVYIAGTIFPMVFIGDLYDWAKKQSTKITFK